MPQVFTIDLDAPVRHEMRYATLVMDFGDGFEQRGNKNQAYTHADGEGGVTSYKGRNRFTITMDMLAHVNSDSTKMANKLWNFYKARLGGFDAFFFYNPAEAPTPDASGVATTGRYLVRFEEQGLTREQFALNLFKAGISMIEVRA